MNYPYATYSQSVQVSKPDTPEATVVWLEFLKAHHRVRAHRDKGMVVLGRAMNSAEKGEDVWIGPEWWGGCQ